VTKSWDKSARVLRLKVEQTRRQAASSVFRVPLDVEITSDGGHALIAW
jgi:hypothetical protein